MSRPTNLTAAQYRTASAALSAGFAPGTLDLDGSIVLRDQVRKDAVRAGNRAEAERRLAPLDLRVQWSCATAGFVVR